MIVVKNPLPGWLGTRVGQQEQAFELEEIPEDDMKTIATVADLVKYISRKVEVAT